MKKNIFGPYLAEDRTRDPPHKNPTLYRVALKAGLYRKAVQMCYIPIPCDILPLHIEIRLQIFTGVRESLEMRLKEVSCTCGLFTLGAKCNRQREISSVLTRPRIEPATLHTKIQHSYHIAIKAGLYRKAVQVCYIPIPCDIKVNLNWNASHHKHFQGMDQDYIGATAWENLLTAYANNKGAA